MKRPLTIQFLVLYICVVDQIEFICFAELFDYFLTTVYFYIDIVLVMTKNDAS